MNISMTTKLYLPSEFKIADGLIRWEGCIAVIFAGDIKFRFTYAGYAKSLDRWKIVDG